MSPVRARVSGEKYMKIKSVCRKHVKLKPRLEICIFITCNAKEYTEYKYFH